MKSALESYFSRFRANIIGQDLFYETRWGRKRLLYADWTASGRGYLPIELQLVNEVLPFYGNTHSEMTVTGTTMTEAYEGAKRAIKSHVRCGEGDIGIFCGSGMTSAVNKLQRMLGLRRHGGVAGVADMPMCENERPLVLVSHMEHHSNHTSWLETTATVEVIRPDANGDVDLDHLRELLEKYSERRLKIAAVTACSNVTGIKTRYHAIAEVMHACGGLCFVDFASAAPYMDIDMHPCGTGDLDAIYFSMHKFLGGPGTPGILVFDQKLYGCCAPDQCGPVGQPGPPDQPGGGTVLYTNPWGDRDYLDDIELREDGGTPPILQGIKAAFCIRLKEEMGVERMLSREKELTALLMDGLENIRDVEILAGTRRDRLGIVSFLVGGMHHDDVVKNLNDRFGIQARGGCSCAGTYGHFLLGIERPRSETIRRSLLAGDLRSKPGWVRLSLHPTMTDEEVNFLAEAVEAVAKRKQRVGVRISCPVPRI